MAGNSQRRGAVRKPGSKKGSSVGTGGKGRRALEGRGPTPKAEDRPAHPAARRKMAAERPADAPRMTRTSAPTRTSSPARTGGSRPGTSGVEVVAGRNSVVEALRANVPATAVYVGHRIEADDRVREILRAASSRGIPLLEVTKPELDRLTDGSVHQGVAIQVPAFSYAHPVDLLAVARRSGAPPGYCEQIHRVGVAERRNLDRHALVHRAVGQPIKLGLRDLEQRDPAARCRPQDLPDPVIGLDAMPDVHSGRRYVGAKSLDDGVAPGDRCV